MGAGWLHRTHPKGWGVKRLNGMDAMLLYSETPNLHTHTLKVAIINAADYEGEFTFDVFRRTIARRLHLLDPLRYRLIDIPWNLHHPMWLEDCPVDLDYHLRRVQVPAPGGRRELDEVIGHIASTPLDRSHPLWEFHFAEGMADDRFALIGKVHHTLADGVASANLLARLMDLSGSAADESDDYADMRSAHRHPSCWQRRVATTSHTSPHCPGWRRMPPGESPGCGVRTKERSDHPDLAKMFKTPPTFLNHVVSPVRTFATASLSLAEVKETAKHLGVTFNDIVLATAAGGLRELLLRYDGRADRPLMASVPVSTDRSPDRVTGNEIGGLSVSLPVHIDDPLERVRLTSLSTGARRRTTTCSARNFRASMMEYLPPQLTPALFRWQSKRAAHNRLMNVAVSSVPGPREHGHIGGATGQ